MIWSDIRREARFILQKKSTVYLLIVACLLSAFSVWTGSKEVAQQHATIARLLAADKIDRQAVLHQQQDYGGVAYYSFHLTYAAPSSLAFAALGARDIYPWKHRIRMLALEGQIHESDTENPELALAGRIDFSFVISVLAPLLLVLLLHDLQAVERASGRLDLLNTSAHSRFSLWPIRTGVILLSLAVTLLLPFWFGAVIHQVTVTTLLKVTLLVVGYLTGWALLCFWVARIPFAAPTLASLLLGIWLLTTFIVPALANVVIEQMIKGPQGGDILMVQREAVNDAWDLPVATTMDAFIATHPQWQSHTKMNSLFEWKWFYAFQQVGDQTAQPLSDLYLRSTERKYQVAGWVAWLSPSTLIQRTITNWAQTDAVAARRYQQQVRDFHAQLRHFYYPLLFKEQPFELDVFTQRPDFVPVKP